MNEQIQVDERNHAITALQEENAKLREALAEILKWFGDYPSFIPSYENVIQDRVEDAIEQARAALAEPRKE